MLVGFFNAILNVMKSLQQDQEVMKNSFSILTRCFETQIESKFTFERIQGFDILEELYRKNESNEELAILCQAILTEFDD